MVLMLRIVLFTVFLYWCIPQTVQAQIVLLTPEQARRDAETLHRLLFKMHPAPFVYISRDSLQKRLDALPRFDGPAIPRLEFECRVRDILGLVGCGHTYAQAGRRLKGVKTVKDPALLPLYLFSDGERLWVRQSLDTNQQRIPPGASILRLGTQPLPVVLDRIRRHNPSDGYNQTFGLKLLNAGPFTNVLFRKYFPVDTVLDVRWQMAPDSAAQTTRLRAIPQSKMVTPKVSKPDTTIQILHSTRKKDQYFYLHPQHPDIGVLKINAFRGKGIRLYKKAFATMRERKTPYLVVDVRDNLGGNFESCVDLSRYFADTTTTILASRRLFRTWQHPYRPLIQPLNRLGSFLLWDVLSTNRRWIKQDHIYYQMRYKPFKRKHYDGQVFILQNGWSFSASSLFAALSEAKSKKVTIVGDESGGGSRTNNGMQIPKFLLRECNMTVHIPQINLQYNIGQDEGKGVMPDHLVRYTINDVLAGRDLEWEKVLALLKH
jgi:Peptidase family S41